MKVRTICACMSTALLISFSTSNVFADVSPVADRGDLINSDSIFWDTQGFVYSPLPDYDAALVSSNSPANPNVTSVNGNEAAVSHIVDPEFAIWVEQSTFFRDTNFIDGEYFLNTFAFTNGNNNLSNPITFAFADSNTEEICGFGTQIAPFEVGGFNAEIQAFDGSGSMGTPIVVTGSDLDADAAFIGMSSTTAMTSVQVVVTSTGDGGGSLASWYALNQVTLTYCSDLPVEPPPEPEVPAMSCEGFAAPMANHPVKAKKNRVFPLKMELFDADGFEQTDVELAAAPVVTVMFASSGGGDAVDVSDEALSAGHGSDGNLFDYTDDGIWQFNLKSKNYKASGTYYVTVDSGDELEYVIEEPSCVTSFIIK